MIEIRFATKYDKELWFELDKHLEVKDFLKKALNKECLILLDDNKLVGILRFNYFWDNIPFINLIYIKEEYQRKNYGKTLVLYFESKMKDLGYNLIMTSTQSDELAQHFYRKLGYKEAGSLIFDTSVIKQALEIVFIKEI